jgi:WD40 repeat protein
MLAVVCAVVCVDRSVRIWDARTGQPVCRLQGHVNRVFRVQFDSLRIVSSSQDDTMIIWDFSSEVVAAHRRSYDALDSVV